MHQEPCPQAIAALIADSSFYLPGFRLIHLLHLVCVADQRAVARVQCHLKDQGACIGRATVVRYRQVYAQRIALEGIGERRARALRDQLLRLEGVLRVTLEHCFVRSAPAADLPAATATCSPCTAQ